MVAKVEIEERALLDANERERILQYMGSVGTIEEALRVMNSLKEWTSGKEKGKAVKVSYTVPIKFALDDKPKTEEK